MVRMYTGMFLYEFKAVDEEVSDMSPLPSAKSSTFIDHGVALLRPIDISNVVFASAFQLENTANSFTY